MNIDAGTRQREAATIVEELVGAESLHRLVQLMLDHEIPPAFMWRRTATPVDRDADELRTRLASAISSEAAERRVREVLADVPGLERDNANALMQLATAPGYFEIPDTLLEVPSRSSRVLSALPHLVDRLDNRGLLDLAGLRATPGAVFINEYALSYHQLLRRGFNSHVNDALLGYLLQLQRKRAMELRVAIDERRLRLTKDYHEYLERDYWYGPHLTEEVLDSPDPSPSALIHRWADPDDPRRIFDPSEEFAIRLTLDGQTRTIEAEELVAPERAKTGSEFVFVRYLHAQRDISDRVFIHVDGAVRAYLPEAYARRRGAQGFPPHDKDLPSRYRKVFRVDGSITTGEWSQIVALWFRGNHLTIEALEQLAGVHEATPA